MREKLSARLIKRLRDELGLPVVAIERIQRGPSGKAAGTFAWSADLDPMALKGRTVGSEDTMAACVATTKLHIMPRTWHDPSELVVSIE